MSRLINADALIDKIVNTPTTPCAQKYVGNFVYMDGTATRQNEIIDMINEQPTIEPEQRWIPCKEALPEHGGWFIVTRTITEEEDKWVGLWWYSSEHEWEWGEQPDAWMPMPEPYGGEVDAEKEEG